MKLIKLTKGMYAQVDDCDFDYLNKFKWHVFQNSNTFYAARSVVVDNKYYRIKMHREILGLANSNIIIDHIDHNGLNNTRINLREVSKSLNSRNKRNRKHSSKYCGVYHNGGRWIAKISIMGHTIFLGKFDNEDLAHNAYLKAKSNPKKCVIKTLEKIIQSCKQKHY